MRVLVIGATGLTGQVLVRCLLGRGDDVTALARDPAQVAGTHERLHVARGEARDAPSLESAARGQDAVVSAFGPRALFGKSDLQEVFMRNLATAMKAAGVRRLVNLAAWGAGNSDPMLTWFARLFKRAARDFFADKDRGGGDSARVFPLLSREDLAAFMIEQLTGDAWLRKSPLIWR